jgi:hypothetical protein
MWSRWTRSALWASFKPYLDAMPFPKLQDRDQPPEGRPQTPKSAALTKQLRTGMSKSFGSLSSKVRIVFTKRHKVLPVRYYVAAMARADDAWQPSTADERANSQLQKAAGQRWSKVKGIMALLYASMVWPCMQSNDNVATLDSESPHRSSPSSASFTSSRRTSDDKSQSLKQKLANKVTMEPGPDIATWLNRDCLKRTAHNTDYSY